jgi:hypothetical protein
MCRQPLLNFVYFFLQIVIRPSHVNANLILKFIFKIIILSLKFQRVANYYNKCIYTHSQTMMVRSKTIINRTTSTIEMNKILTDITVARTSRVLCIHV